MKINDVVRVLLSTVFMLTAAVTSHAVTSQTTTGVVDQPSTLTEAVVKQKLIGTWQLVYSVETDAAGHKTYPFGQDAIGYLVYDAEGKMTVQISRKERAKFASTAFKKASDAEARQLPQDYLAYFGTYTIDTVHKVVSHHVEGALFPNYIGRDLPRGYTFYDNKLSLKPVDGTDREILWQKVVD